MKKIGIKNLNSYTLQNIKKEYLLFDEILFDGITYMAIPSAQQTNASEFLKKIFSTVDYLQKKSIIKLFDPLEVMDKFFSSANKDFVINNKKIWKRIEMLLLETDKIKTNNSEKAPLLSDTFIEKRDMIVRICSNIYEINDKNKVYTPITHNEYFCTDTQDRKERVLKIVLNKLPYPDNSVRWDQLIDFKNDPDTQSKNLALRNWMTDISYSKLSDLEIEEKIEYLLNEYEDHINLHKLKYNMGTIEILVTTTAEILENIVTIKWSKIAKKLFSLRQCEIDLFEIEKKAPGREVAYISKVVSGFGNKKNT